MNKQNYNQQINQIEQLINEAKLALKSWASQISQHHKTLKALTQQLETIKQEINMNMKNNKLNNQGENH